MFRAIQETKPNLLQEAHVQIRNWIWKRHWAWMISWNYSVGEAKKSSRLMLFQKHLEVSYSFKISKQYKWACNSHWQWSSLHSVQSSGTMWIINMIWKKVPKSSQSSHCLQTQMPSFHCKMALAAGMSVMCKDWNPVRNSPNFQPMQLLSYANYSRDGQRVVGNMAK